MKHYVVLFLFVSGVFMSKNSLSQIQLPFPDSTGAWTIKGSGSNWPDPPTYYAYRHYINGDTIVNGISYAKLYTGAPFLNDSSVFSYSLRGLFRIDSLKVYFKNINMTLDEFGFIDTSDILLYDFDMNVGDSILNFDNGSGSQNYLIVESIDTILLNSLSLKRWNFISSTGWMPYGLTWIEGIGSDIGFFTYFTYFESGINLACFHELNQDFIFDLGNSPDCASVGIAENISDNTISVYPNPVYDILMIDFESKTNATVTYEITDMLGKIVSTHNVNVTSGMNRINLSAASFDNGFYTVTLIENNHRTTVKLIKQ